MKTGAFDKPMTMSEAQEVLIHALFTDEEHLDDYEKDFDGWLSSGLRIRSVCAG